MYMYILYNQSRKCPITIGKLYENWNIDNEKRNSISYFRQTFISYFRHFATIPSENEIKRAHKKVIH